MVEIKPEDITLFARLGFLVYVDGYTSKICSMRPSVDQNGNDVWEFVLDPSMETIKRFSLKSNTNRDMTYKQSIPYELVFPLNLDPSWTRFLYLRTYEGIETPASKLLQGNSQQKIIMELKKELRVAQMKVEVANERLHLMETNMPKYLARNVSPFFDQFAPFIEKMITKESKKE